MVVWGQKNLIYYLQFEVRQTCISDCIRHICDSDIFHTLRTSGIVSTPLYSTKARHTQPQPPSLSTSHHTTPGVSSTHLSLPPSSHSTIIMQPPAKSTTNTTWKVVPPSVVIPASDTTPREFFVVNFGTEQETFEVRSSSRDLQVTPSEALLPGQSSVRVCVSLLAPQRALTAPSINSIKVSHMFIIL